MFVDMRKRIEDKMIDLSSKLALKFWFGESMHSAIYDESVVWGGGWLTEYRTDVCLLSPIGCSLEQKKMAFKFISLFDVLICKEITDKKIQKNMSW